MTREFSHITLVVEDLDESLGAYETVLQASPEDQGGLIDEVNDVRLATIPISGIRLELMQPKPSANGLFTQFLEERGPGVISYCVVLDNYDEEIDRLKDNGVTVEEHVQDELFPDHSFRLAYALPAEKFGCRIELVDADGLPEGETSL